MDKSLTPFMRCCFAAAFALVSVFIFPADAAQREAIRIDLSILPAAKRYVELAAYPSLLVVALQVNGFSPSHSGRIVVEDGGTLRFKNAGLKFVRQEKGIYHYSATVDWSIGIAQSKLEFPVEADLSKVGEGTATIRVFSSFAQLVPEPLIEQMRLKVESVANHAVQQRVLEYFEGLPGGGTENQLETGRMFERILIDAYNLPAVAPGLSGAREPGDAESLADQWMLLATLAIWFVVVPGFFMARAAWRRKTKPDHRIGKS
jgi:hypothetical protein